MNVYDKGIKTRVIVDDFIPCNGRPSPEFTTTKTNELWVIILEKVWAKLYSNYANIEGGVTKEVLHDLTGAPTKSFYENADPNELWQNILNAERCNYVMNCGSKANE